MAGNDDLQWVAVEGVADGPLCMGMSNRFGDVLVGSGLSVGNGAGGFQYLYLELCAVNLYGNGERLDFACQVEVQFPSGLLIDLGVSPADLTFGLWLSVGACLETAGCLASLEPKSTELNTVEDKSPFPPHVAVVDLDKSGIVEIHPINIYPYRFKVQK